jgi:hypothetical protein
MSKSNTTPNEAVIVTVELGYQSATNYYAEATQLEEEQGNQEQIDRLFKISSFKFWHALILGHPQAPYAVATCFYYGIGVKEDEYLANLFFGVALAQNDPRCQKDLANFQIPSSMNKVITELTQLITTVQQSTNIHNKMDNQQFLDNLLLFDSSIKLPHLSEGQVMSTLFMGGVKDPEPLVNEQYTGTEYHGYQQEDHIAVSGAHQTSDDNDSCCALF